MKRNINESFSKKQTKFHIVELCKILLSTTMQGEKPQTSAYTSVTEGPPPSLEVFLGEHFLAHSSRRIQNRFSGYWPYHPLSLSLSPVLFLFLFLFLL